jgi:hypothetical protein
MRIPKMLVVLICLLSTVGLPTAFAQEQNELREEGGRCTRIKASLATAIVAENCPSPVGLCAAGVIAGNRLIEGTTFASVLGLAPSAGLPGLEPETTLSLAGERTIRASRGTLMLRLAGVFDTARGEFAEIDRVTSGTGRFEGATGTLWITGTGTNVFEGQITGQICTNRP